MNWTIWIIGYLFFVGFVHEEKDPEMTVGLRIFAYIVGLFIWPVILGGYVYNYIGFKARVQKKSL